MQTAIQIIMDTQPKGSAAAGGMSREETVDRIAEDLLGKACLIICNSASQSLRMLRRTHNG